jgi:hypothetical protein
MTEFGHQNWCDASWMPDEYPSVLILPSSDTFSLVCNYGPYSNLYSKYRQKLIQLKLLI